MSAQAHKTVVFNIVVSVCLAFWLITPTPSTHAAPIQPVISEFRTRGPGGASDEFIELFNPTQASVNVGGWKIRGSNSSGAISTRLTIAAGTILQPGQHFLAATTSYSGPTPADQTYSIGLVDDGGLALTTPDDAVVDAVGLSAGSAFGEGNRLAPLTTPTNRSYERQLGGVQGSCNDADDNATDFILRASDDPQNLSNALVLCVNSPEPTATETFTPGPTATETFTPEPTATETFTPEPTATGTFTPGPTATETFTPEPTATETFTPEPTSTRTFTPTQTPSNTPLSSHTPTPTSTPSSGPLHLTRLITASSDDVNQDGSSFQTLGPTVWIGTGANRSASYAGLRFNELDLASGATITSAYLELAGPTNQWIALKFTLRAQNTGDCATFTTSSKPSQRTLTNQTVTHVSNQLWLANTYYALNDIRSVVQAIVNRADWASGNSLCLILQGTGGQWGRKFMYSFEGDKAFTPRLIIQYTLP